MVGEMAERNERKSLLLQMEVSDFRYVAPFQNQNASKATCRKSRPEFTLFDPPNLGRVDEMSE